MLDQGYGLMPNCILYNKELTDKQKLLFCTISSLCAEKWYCRATNEYIWELLGADKSTISRNISVLQEKWFIGVEIDQNYKRKITLCKNSKGDTQKWVGGDTQKWVDNNTSDKITNKNSLEKFEEFWNKRPKKEWRKAALKKFINLSQEKQNKAIDGIDKRKKTDRWQKWIIMAATTYINQERREDEIETKKDKPNTLVYH